MILIQYKKLLLKLINKNIKGYSINKENKLEHKLTEWYIQDIKRSRH